MESDKGMSSKNLQGGRRSEPNEQLRTITIRELTLWQLTTVLASILVVVSALLPWFNVSIFGVSESFTGIDVDHGIVTLILGILSAIAIAWNIISGNANPYKVDIQTALMSFGLSTTLVSLVAVISGASIDAASADVGVILTLIAGLVQLFSAFMMRANIMIKLHMHDAKASDT